jgi:hypothetical protein
VRHGALKLELFARGHIVLPSSAGSVPILQPEIAPTTVRHRFRVVRVVQATTETPAALYRCVPSSLNGKRNRSRANGHEIRDFISSLAFESTSSRFEPRMGGSHSVAPGK